LFLYNTNFENMAGGQGQTAVAAPNTVTTNDYVSAVVATFVPPYGVAINKGGIGIPVYICLVLSIVFPYIGDLYHQASAAVSYIVTQLQSVVSHFGSALTTVSYGNGGKHE
jgi:uncharacterized membrane protein YqaE (UPF0057 family)